MLFGLGCAGLDQDADYHINNISLPFKTSPMDLQMCIDYKLKFHQQVSNTIHKAETATSILKSTINCDCFFIVPLFTIQIHPLLEYASSVWNLGYVGDIRLLELV